MSKTAEVTLVRADSGPSAVHLRLDGARIVHRWGRSGALERQRVAEYATPEEAAKRFEDRAFRLVAKGYRCGAEHPGLLAAIAEAPRDAGTYQVYRDWLSLRDDPRAELIRRTAEPTPGRQIRALLDAHRWQFVRRDWDIFELDWWMGFVQTLRYPRWMGWHQPSRSAEAVGERMRVTNPWARAFLLKLHRHPSGRFLQYVEERHHLGSNQWRQTRWAVAFDLTGEQWEIHLSGAESPAVSINQATRAQLMTVSGIGPRLARRIIRHRQRIGEFTAVDQITEVPGVGATLLAGLRDRIRL